MSIVLQKLDNLNVALQESEYRQRQLDEYQEGVSKLQSWIDDTRQASVKNFDPQVI